MADKTGDTPKQDQPSLLSGLLPSLSTNLRSGLIGHAERTFAIIKRGIRNALVTGLIVAAVRLIPLLWFGLKVKKYFTQSQTTGECNDSLLSVDFQRHPAFGRNFTARDEPVCQSLFSSNGHQANGYQFGYDSQRTFTIHERRSR